MSAEAEQSKRASLRAALERAGKAGEDETVVFHLRSGGGSEVPAPPQMQALASEVINRAASDCGHEPKARTVFDNLGAVAVKGNPALLLKILEQPEVHSASMNQPQGGAVEPIRPVRKSAPKPEGWVDVSK